MKKVTIKKGKHSPFWRFPRLYIKPKGIRIYVIFTESCKYTLNSEDQLDWNKMAGFSRGKHHTDSLRLVWRWNPSIQKIEVGEYRYKNGERISSVIKTVDLYTTYKFTLMLHEGNYPWWGYKLFPYFGGNNPAPHDIHFQYLMKILK
jgi:hypothetical protein